MAISINEIGTRLFKKLLGLGETSSSGREFYEEPYNGPLVSYNTNIWTDTDKIPSSLEGTTNVVNLPIGSYIYSDGTTGSTKNDAVLQVSAWTLNIVLGTSSGTEGFAFVNTSAVDVIPFNYGSIFNYDTNNTITYNNGAANLAFGSNGSIFDPQAGILKFYEAMPTNWDGTSPFVLKGVKYIGNKLSSYDLNSYANNSSFSAFTESFYAYSAYTLNNINNNYSQFTGFTNSFNTYSANTQNALNTKYDKSGGTISGNVTILGNLTVNGTATTVNTVNLLVYDPIIGLALSQSGSTNPTLDSGIITDRGISGNTAFVWIEANKQYELGYTNNSYNDTNVTISNYGDLKLSGLKVNNIYDSSNSLGVTNQFLSSTGSGVKWGNIDYIVTGYTSHKLNINDFNAYSAYTLNNINNNYSQFTGFTDSFNAYSAYTLNILNNKVIELGSGVGSTVRVNANNISSGDYSAVLSGTGNTASNRYSIVVGGRFNNALGWASFIGGGLFNTTSCFYSSILNGSRNTVSGFNSTINGGLFNTITGCNSFIGGGDQNTSNSIVAGVISGGRRNTVSGNCSSISGGYRNASLSSTSFIGGGISNTILASLTQSTSIVGGGVNSASGCYSIIGGGRFNTVSNNYSFIGGGFCNTVSGCFSVVGGGCGNISSGIESFIGSGEFNTITSNCSGILGGRNNLVSACNTFIIGSNLTGNTENTTFVNNLSINGNNQTMSLFTTTNATLNTGLNTIYQIPSNYDGAFIDYIVKLNGNARSGQMTSIWSGTSINYTETTTLDIGDTNSVNFSLIMSGTTPVFVSSATTSGWTVKTIIRAI